jgi:thiol-disulfide isomerase/thioredoxin
MKNKNVNLMLAGAIALALGIYVIFSVTLYQPTIPDPDTEFKLVNGETLILGNLRGKPVLVVFWATTCKICLKEIPDLVELHHKYAKKGLSIVAVAMPYDHPAAVVKYARARKLPYHVALDVDKKIFNAFRDVRVTPTIFLIANEGHVLMRAIGKLKLRKLKQLIDNEIETIKG